MRPAASVPSACATFTRTVSPTSASTRAAQVALRWNAQRGVVVIPKSTHKERMAENFSIWDFALTDEDMAAIAALDLGRSEIIDHGSAETARFLNGWKIHD